jgi:hypothetical protein
MVVVALMSSGRGSPSRGNSRECHHTVSPDDLTHRSLGDKQA